MVQKLSYWKVLTRRKQLSQESADGEDKLNRVLGLYDLTALGVGSTLGAGVYVLAGQIAKDEAGPSVMLSFAIAAFASLLAGICYAEFGARVPKAGSAYVYSYVCIGEFAAFVIGWNLILEYMIGTASVCRGISLYLDTLINDTLKTTFAEVAPINVSFLGSYFDFFACGLVIVFGVALAFGVETSAIANNFCTCLNLFILVFVIIAGSIRANFSNWTIDVDAVNKTDIPPDADLGVGGFFPFGFTGTLRGAATCFFGFVGFDCIATTGEEVTNPRKNIPRSILLSLLVIFLCYFGVSTVLTLMVPYYLQDVNAPLPNAFKVVGWNLAKWIVSIGGLVGLLASLFGALFPLPRVMYSMAQDGLMFRVFGRIHPKYRVPVVGSIVAAILTALFAGLFDLAQLVSLLSIGTLLAYSVVAISITILRYMDNTDTFGKFQPNGNTDNINVNNGHSNIENGNANGISASETSLLTSKRERVTFKAIMIQLFNFKREYTPNELSTRIVGTLITIFCILSAGIGLIFMQAYDALINNQTWVFNLMIILCVFTAVVLLCICLQPREICTRVFTVPLVPLVPAISIFINIYLMLQLDVMTWIRFGVWMAIGIPMFIACWCMYDIKNPANRHLNRIEFERLLKLSFGSCSSNSKPLFKKEKQNNSTAKRLDDIIDLNEMETSLKEIKYPNGQVCYIVDNNSHKSHTRALHKIECKYNEINGASSITDTSEEEKCAIAMLDNVLENLDDRFISFHLLQFYDRKVSVDSEMVPSVIRSTTMATVHNINNCGSSKSSIRNSLINMNDLNAESNEMQMQKIAQKLVDEILNSKELLLALEKHRPNLLETDIPKKIYKKIDLINDNTAKDINLTESYNESNIKILKRVQPANSSLYKNSLNNSLYSEKFRNKLSVLLTSPPDLKSGNEKTNMYNSKQNIYELMNSRNEDNVKESNNFEMKNKIKRQNVTNIPKPPKFDPVLYKTINITDSSKERSTLGNFSAKNQSLRNDKTETNEPHNNESFKQKLDSLLKKGPAHETKNIMEGN